MRETLINDIRAALGPHGGEPNDAAVQSLVRGLHPGDLAFVLDQLTLPEAARVFRLLDGDRAAETLAHVAPTTKQHLLHALRPAEVVDLLRRLPMDEAAEVVTEAGPGGHHLLGIMSGAAARDVERLLEYPDQTAGRLMTTKFAAVATGTSVERTLDYLRVIAPAVETINTVYVVTTEHVLIGVCSIRDLLIAAASDAVDAIMHRDVISVPVDTDQQDVARVIGRYDLTAVPVVDRRGRLVGIVTVDDVLDVLTEEFNEDYAGLVGSDAAEMDRRSPTQIARMRLPWLLGTMVIELCAGAIIARFDAVLREVILLASFMPVISAVSGNVGLQAAAIVVRGLDTGHVSLENWTHAVRRELLAAVSIALVAGTALATVAVVWSRHIPFGIVVGSAMICAIVVASVMGTVIPLVSKRLGFDPATTAGPFETAFQDVIGFSVFLWTASALLKWLI
jgi:magnesium transporter